jgi:putative oxidoreductase
MSKAGATRGTGAAPSRSRGRAANVGLWALRTLLAVAFAMAGLAKIFGAPAMVEMFATIGVGQWFRFGVGALELSGAVGVLIPRLSGPAALGLVCLMAGATLASVIVLGASPLPPIGLLVVGPVVARGGWPRTAALAGRTRR